MGRKILFCSEPLREEEHSNKFLLLFGRMIFFFFWVIFLFPGGEKRLNFWVGSWAFKNGRKCSKGKGSKTKFGSQRGAVFYGGAGEKDIKRERLVNSGAGVKGFAGGRGPHLGPISKKNYYWVKIFFFLFIYTPPREGENRGPPNNNQLLEEKKKKTQKIRNPMVKTPTEKGKF